MPNPISSSGNPRLDILKNAIPGKPELHAAFEKLYTAKKGDWPAIEKSLQKNKKFAAVIKDIAFANALASWTNDNTVLVSHFQNDKKSNSLKDIAFNLSKDGLKKIVKSAAVPKEQTKDTYVDSLYNKLHENEPTAVVVNMINDPKVPLLNTASGKFIAGLLAKNPQFNIRTTSVYELLNDKKIFKGLSETKVNDITTDIKNLQRVMAVSPVPEAITALSANKFFSAYAITLLPPAQFITAMSSSGLPEETLSHIYAMAQEKHALYEQLFINIRETVAGSKVAMIDGGTAKSEKDKSSAPAKKAKQTLQHNNLDWDRLFGDADYCECGECTSFYSAAAYYVDLLQYLRNNNLDKTKGGATAVRPSANDITGTPLQKLFDRRPDLGHLELTCKNTNTILPYVDLVNEVMEQYAAYKTTAAFNVANETSAELLSAPQHTAAQKNPGDKTAYQILSEEVYPFTLPYHQPIDAARIFLNHLGSSRYELINTFPAARDRIKVLEPSIQGGLLTGNLITYNKSAYENSVLDQLYTGYLMRSADAEFLQLSPREYYALTKEVFVNKEYWDTQYFDGGSHGIHTQEEYLDKIGQVPLENYYGYNQPGGKADMFSTDETIQVGLTFVKAQLLSRTGIAYTDLVELLTTQYINPPKPAGGIRVVGDDVGLFNTAQCTLDEVRLKMGIPQLAEKRYDKMHRFIRLWRKLGFTIDETDKIIMAFGGDITPGLLHQMVAVKKIISLTGIALTKLLCFWGDMGTAGDNSLYKQLFLTHNLLAMDDIFTLKNGAYLQNAGTVTTHLPAVMAALNLSAADITAIKTYKSLPVDLPLTIQHLSLLYRYRLLSKALGMRVPAFIKLLEVFGDVFADADTTLEFLTNLAKIEEAGFSADELGYIITGADSVTKSFAPAEKEVIVLAKKIYDGVHDIEQEHADLITDAIGTDEEKATVELVKSKAALIYDTESVEKIAALVSVDSTFSTTIAKSLDFTVPAGTSYGIKYDKQTSLLQVTGELNAAAIADLKLLKDNQAIPKPLGAEWIQGIDTIAARQNSYRNSKQANKDLFDKLLSGLLANTVSPAAAGMEQCIVGDDFLNTSSAKKCLTFLRVFLPYLRDQLKYKLITGALSEQTGLEKNITQSLAVDILKTGSNSLYNTLASITDLANTAPLPAGNWHGKFIPGSDAEYTFKVTTQTNNAVSISIDGLVIISHIAGTIQPASSIELPSAAIKLTAGKVYQLSAEGVNMDAISIKTQTTVFEPVPAANLLPDFKIKDTRAALEQLKKSAVLINTVSLSADELEYFNTHHADFDDIDFNQLRLQPLLRIVDYCSLRNSLPEAKINLLQFWQRIDDSSIILSQHIHDLTQWEQENIASLLSPAHFNLGKGDFKNEKSLLQLQKALAAADKTGTGIDNLFYWSQPSASFDTYREIADSIQKSIRSRYNQTDWEQVVKPLNDILRNNQKNALLVYLLQHPDLKNAGVTDPDSLFEYFLIDVQMDTCMETSRIKQAISSVQLFIQRCFVGAEKNNGIANDLLDRKRWEWMERYRVWEANRKVLLYPENWIESNLRDDKSPFFKEIESELLQKDINKQNVEDALKTYLYKVDEVANMEVVGLYIEGEKANEYTWNKEAKLHIFSRTRNAPYFFYYRYLALDEMNWYPWEKVQVDIPCYDVEDSNGKVTGNGCYLTPVVWNGRLLIFFPQFIKKTKPLDGLEKFDMTFYADLPANAQKPTEYWEIKIACSEYKNKKWQPKQVSSSSVYDIPNEIVFSDLVNRLLIKKKESVTHKANSDKLAGEIDAIQHQLQDAISKANAPLQVSLLQQLVGKSNTKSAEDNLYNTAIQVYSGMRNTIASSPRNQISPVSAYVIFSVIYDNNQSLAIKIFRGQTRTGQFEYDGNTIKLNLNSPVNVNNYLQTYFQYSSSKFSAVQIPWNNADSFAFSSPPSSINNQIPFYFSTTGQLINKLNGPSLNSFFQHNLSLEKENGFGLSATSPNKIYHELKRPYALYNWELFFHIPVMIAETLSKAQQFEEAMKWFHYVFNPMKDGADTDDKRFWEFAPFKEVNSKNILEKIFGSLQANTPNDGISEWRNNPFKPHLVARSRPVAYMKWVVMKYIDNIIDWGDYLYRQDTIESINQATQLYILAGHILGPRPEMIPKQGSFTPQTYLSLLNKWDAVSNAISELEVAAIYNSTVIPAAVAVAETASTNFIGSPGSLYFCIPNNPKLAGYWVTIADRLFKIRHCQNIEGVFRKLPLFEPPIDPALLVKAAAQGLSISSVINDLNTTVPNYRFYYLLQKALELCTELKSLGGALLAAIEKKDNETVALIRSRHEGTMNNLVLEIKKLQLDEAQKSLESLKQNRKAPEARMKYYLQLAGEDINKIPTPDSDFTELANNIEKPLDESGLRLSKFEKEDVDKSAEAARWQIAIGSTEAVASLLNLFPLLATDVKPFGIGVGANFGGNNLGSAVSAVARALQTVSSQLSFEASHAAKKGGFQRALQERIMQANAAGYDLKQIDKQITAQLIRINITNQEILNQQKQIANAGEIEEFLKNKYSNEELYTWMKGSLKTLYRQVYNLAYDLAKKAEKTFCFERGASNANFIQPGYFDAGREGLLAGEQLYAGLKQLEAAYQEKRGYDYEITKHISLRQLDPFALLQLKAASFCEFTIPEVLFDMDYPGHYKRRIKSVSISIPCIAGPYTSVNATLRLLNNKFRNSTVSSNYSLQPEEQFASYNIPIAAIATSSAQNDPGMFELNFKDERYLPFEGAGVISGWRLELPEKVRQFDYNTISDIVIHVKYIASEGGENLKAEVNKSVFAQLNNIGQQLNKSGLHIPISLKHDMPNEWNLVGKNTGVTITPDKSRLPYMAQHNASIESVVFFIKVKNDLPNFAVTINGTEKKIPLVNQWGYAEIPPGTAFTIYVVPTELAKLEDLIMVVKYVY